MQELQKRQPSTISIRSPGIPKEFEDSDRKVSQVLYEELIYESFQKSIGKSILSAFRHSSHDDTATEKSGEWKNSSIDSGNEANPEQAAIA